MSVKHPIISVTGSSGAGTTTVKATFERIFAREKIDAAWIEGDAFHRYDRLDMRRVMAEAEATGNDHFSHFGPEANLLPELEAVFKEYARSGTGQTRHYVHDDKEAEKFGAKAGTFTDWKPFHAGSNVLFYEGLHGSFMSRANSIVIPGSKLDLAMQLILTPMILQLFERARRAS
jgi:phosphoribulokinase